MKVNKDIPFIEFKISNALYQQGFIYSPDHMGNPPAESVSERARQILLDADVVGLHVVPYRIHHEKFRAHDDYVKIKVPGPDIVLRAVTPHQDKNDLSKRLHAYVQRVEGYQLPDGKIDFTHGFWFFRNKRAQSREVNYQHAKSELERLRQA